MGKNYNKKQICKINILDILDTERSRTGEGIIEQKLLGLAHSGNDFGENFYGLIQEMETQGLVLVEHFPGSLQRVVSIKPKGRVELNSFLRDADKGSKNLFNKQRPFIVELMDRIRLIEIFISSLGTITVFGLITFFIIFLEKNGTIFSGIQKGLIMIFVGIPLSLSILFFLVSFMGISFLGLGFLISQLGFHVGFKIMENAEKIVRYFTWGILILGTIIAIEFSGVKGFVGGIVFNLAYGVWTNRLKILEWVENIQKKYYR